MSCTVNINVLTTGILLLSTNAKLVSIPYKPRSLPMVIFGVCGPARQFRPTSYIKTEDFVVTLCPQSVSSFTISMLRSSPLTLSALTMNSSRALGSSPDSLLKLFFSCFVQCFIRNYITKYMAFVQSLTISPRAYFEHRPMNSLCMSGDISLSSGSRCCG